jgi:hypothetical protein
MESNPHREGLPMPLGFPHLNRQGQLESLPLIKPREAGQLDLLTARASHLRYYGLHPHSGDLLFGRGPKRITNEIVEPAAFA